MSNSPLDTAAFKTAAAEYAKSLSAQDVPSLYGVTDGKAVGTYVEHRFNEYLEDRFEFESGNSAKGIDFPNLGIDLKVTSIKQPQSSCPFRDATQKVYGLWATTSSCSCTRSRTTPHTASLA